MDQSARLCRVCLAPEGGLKKYRRLIGEDSSFARDLHYLSGIMIVEVQGSLSLICDQCQVDLAKATRFKRVALVADEYFRSQIWIEESKLWKSAMVVKAEVEELEIIPCDILKQEMVTEKSHLNEYRLEPFAVDVFEESFQDLSEDEESEKFEHEENVEIFTDLEPTKTESKSPRKRKTKKELKKHQCHCGLVVSTPKRLREHQLTRHEDIPMSDYIPCHICGKKFKVQSYAERHIKMKHTDPDSGPLKRVPCSVCGKLLVKGALKAHEDRHFRAQGIKSATNYVCDFCGHITTEKTYILQHIERIHLKLKKFKCKFCPAAFIHGSLLDYHTRKHLNLRPFACRFCNKTFTRAYCCKIHERIHTDERPYSCRYCDRTFIHHSDHRRHELRHTGMHKKLIG